MNRLLPVATKILGGFFATALFAFPQAYTISAKPGAVNYIEGNGQLDGQPLTVSNLKSVFMNAGSVLETRDGKVEVLLAPGVFLRVGDNSRVRMLKPSLIDTQIAIEAGESMVEVDQFVKDSHITVSVHGGLAEIAKNGLYRFRADGEASVAVIDGKLDVSFGEKHASVGKGHEVLLTDALKVREFDKNQPDEMYAWSNIRAEYNASLTYQAARSVNSSGYGSGGGYNGYSGYGGLYNGGFGGGFYGNGWYWSNGFNSWLWMPGGQFFSPFGWGFYGPGFVSYAPVVYVPVVGGGGVGNPVRHPHPALGNGLGVPVPVNAKAPPALGHVVSSPAQFAAARAQTAHSIASSGGFRTASGASVSSFGAAHSSGVGSVGSHSSGGGSFSSSSSSASSGGGHSGGGGGGSSGGHGK